ncbi:unnamed protein product [Caenorhabditis auriculariae]|uniref:G-protein coupled receptors family 1 profile domain-containing protein n=1 Tax=Caenorhabditis auriculariae TaxID=2777116 RepID=A0A8S1GRW9_9PELO|nr:unnamed protein product [Caenorhabditis auriculariae]
MKTLISVFEAIQIKLLSWVASASSSASRFNCVSSEKSEAIRRFLGKHLLLTNIATSCTQIGTADVIQQYLNGDVTKFGWDWRRTCRMAAIGFVMAPALHGFYRVLDTRKFKGSRQTRVLKKLAWDTAFIPFFSCTFITVGALYEGQTLNEALAEYRRKMWHIWKVDFTIWPPAQLINFYFFCLQRALEARGLYECNYAQVGIESWHSIRLLTLLLLPPIVSFLLLTVCALSKSSKVKYEPGYSISLRRSLPRVLFVIVTLDVLMRTAMFFRLMEDNLQFVVVTGSEKGDAVLQTFFDVSLQVAVCISYLFPIYVPVLIGLFVKNFRNTLFRNGNRKMARAL